MKQWAKREEQIEHVMGAIMSMYMDLPEIEGLSLLALERGKTI